MNDTLIALSIVAGIIFLVLTVLWILLPFAVFGSKEKLDE